MIKGRRGLTLLEAIVAMTIAAVLWVMLYQFYNMSLESYQRSRRDQKSLNELMFFHRFMRLHCLNMVLVRGAERPSFAGLENQCLFFASVDREEGAFVRQVAVVWDQDEVHLVVAASDDPEHVLMFKSFTQFRIREAQYYSSLERRFVRGFVSGVHGDVPAVIRFQIEDKVSGKIRDLYFETLYVP